MRDDDDKDADVESGSRLGKLIYTDFDSAPERADYSLPLGEPALQGCGPEFGVACDSGRREAMSRRQVLLLGVLGGLTCGGGLVWGLTTQPAQAGARGAVEPPVPNQLTPQIQMMLDGARVLAGKPIDDLVRVHVMYLWLVQHHGRDDATLWKGVQRLSQWALLDRKGRGVAMARRLIAVMESSSSPPALDSTRFELERLVWESDRWRRKE